FHLQAKRRTDNEYWAYDTTSISSASELLRQVQYGKNKEDDKMPQLNLALVFGEESNLPFYYRKLAGNVPDCRTLLHLLSEFDVLGFPKAKMVMDRGFYSEANINELLKNHIKFLISTKMTISFVRNELDVIYDGFRDAAHFYDEYGLYAHTVPIEWEYRQKRPYKKDVLTDKKRCYLHLYYNIEQAAEEEVTFDRHLMKLRRELLEDRRVADNETQYQKYFLYKDTPKRGVQVSVIQDAVNRDKRYLGYFTLLGNEKMDAMQALETYRNKDAVEKAFGNLKERLSMRRMLVSSEKSLDGKLFIQFIALIYLSYIKKRMQEKRLFGTYTLQEVFDKLDSIECYENQGRQMRVSEVTAKQRQLYLDMGITPPKSSL
ncbi:MAG: IS1634 family transposase, partial [Smithella sp.]